jgi:hypothetical protein
VVDRSGEREGEGRGVRRVTRRTRTPPRPSRALLDLLCPLVFDDSLTAQVARVLAVIRAPAAAGIRAAFGCDSTLALGFRFHRDRVVLSQRLRPRNCEKPCAFASAMGGVSETKFRLGGEPGRRNDAVRSDGTR